MLIILLNLFGNIVIPNSINLMFSALSMGVTITLASFILITMFAFIGLKVHADMNSTIAGAIFIGVGYSFKMIFKGVYNLVRTFTTRLFSYFKRLTRSQILAYTLSALILIVVI